MKKILLTASSKLNQHYLRTVFVLLLVIGISAVSDAQCIGPFQGYQSVDPVAANMTGAGWQFTGSPAFATTASTTLSRTGGSYLRQAGTIVTMPSIVTPQIMTPQTFSFWIKGTVGTPYTVDFSDDGKATWVNIPNGATNVTGGNGLFSVSTSSQPAVLGAVTASAYVLCTITAAFPADVDGYYFRINNGTAVGSSGTLLVDDISWKSSVSTDNILIIPDITTTATCTVTVPAGGVVYKYYDAGGSSDKYSLAQTNNFIFTPANPTDKIRVTFKNSFRTTTTTDVMTVYNSNAIGTASVGAFSGGPFTTTATLPFSAATPVNSFTSTFASGEVSIGFPTTSGTQQTGYEIWVECIGSSCADPTSATMGAITPTSATLNWTGTAPVGYEYTYTTSNVAPSGSGTAVGSSTFTGTATGLTSNTQYYMWVRSQCASTFSNWISAGAFTTLCAPVGVPYAENFNGWSVVLPTCTSKSGGTWATNSTNGNLYGVSAGTFFFTKPITLSASTIYKLSYDFSAAVSGNANFDVYIGPANDMTMLTPANRIFSHTNVTSTLTNNAFDFTSSATPGTYYIGFYIVSTTNPGITQLNLDNILLDVETCIAPTSVAAFLPTASSGTVTWTAPSPVPSGGYEYYISTSNTPPVSSTTASGIVPSGTIKVIGGLTSSTTYYVWVRSNCGGGVTSLWSTSFATFTTSFVVTTTVNMTNGSNGPGGSCSVNFFDSGGASSNYVDNEDYTYTFYPGTAGSKVKAVFGSFSTESRWDGMMIYSGTTANPANLISSGAAVGNNATTCPAGAWSGTNTPGTVISTDATGALTIVFKTDTSVQSSGWAATLSCVTVPVVSSFTPTDNNCAVGTTTVTITGSNFTGANPVNGVFFNGVAAASFNVVSNSLLTAVLPSSGVTTGIISVSNATATGYSTAQFTVNSPKPTTTGVTICTGGSGNLTTSTTCGGFVNSGTSFSGNLTGGTDPTANILGTSISNSAVCNFNTGVQRNYTATTFQVNVSGTYVFEVGSGTTFDSMAYIVRSPFTPGTCSSNWVVGDDDSGAGFFSQLTASLTAGVTYILYTTSWSISSGTYTGPYTWTITPPPSGQIMLPGTPLMDWYVDASTTTVLGSGNTFNPVGVSGSGLANTNTATSVTYYGACPSNPTCRTATVYLINPRPTVTFTAQPGSTACTYNDVTYTTQPGQTNYIWTVPGVLGTDYTITSGGIGTTNNTVTLQWLTTGVKTITINYSNASGCAATAVTSSTATTVSASGLSTSLTPTTASICANVAQVLTASSGTANFFTWTTTAGALFTDAACTVPYVAATNFATVYFKGTTNATVTVYGTVGGTGCSASNTANITVNKAVWNGASWSNAGVGPSNTISAEFQGNFTSSVNASATSGNLSACSVIVTSGTVLINKGTLTVQNAVAVNAGALNFDDSNYDVSLYQPNTVTNGPGLYNGGNTGNINFLRHSAGLFRYDYTYWSTPVYNASQYLFALFPASPYGLFLEFNNNAWAYIPNPSTTSMVPAKGYAVRAPLGIPTGFPGSVTYQPAPFNGIPNSGTISIPVLGGSGQMNLLGNPYPSALSANAFVAANPSLNGSLYFWSHATQSQAPYAYSAADYGIWNTAGSVGTAPQPGSGNGAAPNGHIASGQGFFVQGLSNGTAVYTNSMREAGFNNNFYRNTADGGLEKNRYWLNIQSPEAFKQALVGYIETATSGIDRLFDAESVEAGNAVSLYTKVGDVKLSIQGRPLPFDITDTVPLIYRSNSATTYTISIPEYDGLFTSQHVYLQDNDLNVIHDLTESAYTFATEAGTFENRFVLRYTDQALGTSVFNENSVIVYRNGNNLIVNAGNETMDTVTIFDMTGRLIAVQKGVNNTTTTFTTLPDTQQVLLVKIVGDSGRTVTKKVVY